MDRATTRHLRSQSGHRHLARGNDCDAGVKGIKGIYTYTLNDDQFTQEIVDDPCGPRRDAFDAVTYRAIQ